MIDTRRDHEAPIPYFGPHPNVANIRNWKPQRIPRFVTIRTILRAGGLVRDEKCAIAQVAFGNTNLPVLEVVVYRHKRTAIAEIHFEGGVRRIIRTKLPRSTLM
jgi:hypothetical protein